MKNLLGKEDLSLWTIMARVFSANQLSFTFIWFTLCQQSRLQRQMMNKIHKKCKTVREVPKVSEKNGQVLNQEDQDAKNQNIFVTDIPVSASNNFTFGAGNNWIKCGVSLDLWMICGVEMLFFLHFSTHGSQVTNSWQQFQDQVWSFIEEVTGKGQKPKLGIQSILRIKKFFQSLEKLNNESNMQKKLDKICELVNNNRLAHEFLTKFINSLFKSKKNFSQLGQSFCAKFSWEDYPKKMVLNSRHQCEFKFSSDGVLRILLDDYKNKQAIKKEGKRLMRKNTIQSVGEISDEDESSKKSLCNQLRIQTEESLMIKQDIREWDPKLVFNFSTEIDDSQQQKIQKIQMSPKKPLSIQKQFQMDVKLENCDKNTSSMILLRSQRSLSKDKSVYSSKSSKIIKSVKSEISRPIVTFKYISPISTHKKMSPISPRINLSRTIKY